MINAESSGFPLDVPFTKKYHPIGRHLHNRPEIKVFPERSNIESSPEVYKFDNKSSRFENNKYSNAASSRFNQYSNNNNNGRGHLQYFSENFYPKLDKLDKHNIINSNIIISSPIDNMDKHIQYLIPKHNIHEINHIRNNTIRVNKENNVNNMKDMNSKDTSVNYLMNCGEYNIKENEYINEDRLITYETKPKIDYDNILGSIKSYNKLPAIKVNKCPKFYEK